MSALEALLEQALQLPEWSAEIDRRVREVDDGSAELLNGAEVLIEVA